MSLYFEHDFFVDEEINKYRLTKEFKFIINIFKFLELYMLPNETSDRDLLKMIYLYGSDRELYSNEENNIVNLFPKYNVIYWNQSDDFIILNVLTDLQKRDGEYYALALHKIIEKAFNFRTMIIFEFQDELISTISIADDFDTINPIFISNFMDYNEFKNFIKAIVNIRCSTNTIEELYNLIVEYFYKNFEYYKDDDIYLKLEYYEEHESISINRILDDIDCQVEIIEERIKREKKGKYNYRKAVKINKIIKELNFIIKSQVNDNIFLEIDEANNSKNESRNEEKPVKNVVTRDEIDDILSDIDIEFDDPMNLIDYF